MKTVYKPIDCGWYDHLELAAVRKEKVQLVLTNKALISGIIKTFETRKGYGEFLIFDDGSELRLDQIKTFNGQEITGSCTR